MEALSSVGLVSQVKWLQCDQTLCNAKLATLIPQDLYCTQFSASSSRRRVRTLCTTTRLKRRWITPRSKTSSANPLNPSEKKRAVAAEVESGKRRTKWSLNEMINSLILDHSSTSTKMARKESGSNFIFKEVEKRPRRKLTLEKYEMPSLMKNESTVIQFHF